MEKNPVGKVGQSQSLSVIDASECIVPSTLSTRASGLWRVTERHSRVVEDYLRRSATDVTTDVTTGGCHR